MQRPFARGIFASPWLAIVLLLVSSASAQYKATQLVSNLANVAPHQDSKLLNAWGIARGATSPFWVSDNGTGKSTQCRLLARWLREHLDASQILNGHWPMHRQLNDVQRAELTALQLPLPTHVS